MDSVILDSLADRIQQGDFDDIHSLLIIRNGYLIDEHYFAGYKRNDLHQVYSVTKSVTSILIGIAIDLHQIDSLPQRVLSFFPEYSTIGNWDMRKDSITLEDLLTMRAGFSWDEQSYPYGHPDNTATQMSESTDWIKFVLDRPMISNPGNQFRYNSGVSMLLSGIMKHATNQQVKYFANQYLFNPLNIDKFKWDNASNGLSNTGWGLYLRPQDMAKIGYLILNEGTWNKQMIVSSSWINKSTTNHVTGSNYSYGYQWWMTSLKNIPGHTPAPNDILIAWGYGSQFIFVIPCLNMIVVTTGGDYDEDSDQPVVFLFDYIFRAVKDDPSF
jgi:CubicO group peptidase (beta-lactamase class C family)